MKAIGHENLLKEKDKKLDSDSKHDVTIVEKYEYENEIDQGESVEVAAAKMTIDRPYVCQALKSAKVREKFKGTIMAKAKYT